MRLPIVPLIVAATILTVAVYLFNSSKSGHRTLDVPRLTRLADIDGTETEVAIAPDGNRYAVISGGDLWILDISDWIARANHSNPGTGVVPGVDARRKTNHLHPGPRYVHLQHG